MKLLELISYYSKDAGYKLSIKKSMAFLYEGNEQLDFEIRNATPFISAPKVIKYLGVSLTKYVQDPQNKIQGPEKECRVLQLFFKKKKNQRRSK